MNPHDAETRLWGQIEAVYRFSALRAAYRAAATDLHPDHGGSTEQMQKLNDVWARVAGLFIKKEDGLANVPRETGCDPEHVTVN